MIDAKITRWALPHYSPSPRGRHLRPRRGRSRRGSATDYDRPTSAPPQTLRRAAPTHGRPACSEAWSETTVGGSPEAERLEFERARARHHARPAQDREDRQRARRPARRRPRVPRQVDPGASTTPSCASSTFPPDLRAGFAQPGASYPTVVRFSNASGIAQPDTEPDLRGVALRVQVSPEETARPADDELSRSRTPATPTSSSSSPRPPPAARVSRLLGIVGLRPAVRPRRDRCACCATSWPPAGARSTQRRHRDVLEPRRDPLGRRRWPCATCSGRRPARRRRPPSRRTTRATSPTRRPAGSLQGDVRLRAVHPAVRRRRGRPRSRTPPSSGRSASRRPSRWPCSRSRAATSAPSTRWRRPGSSTRWPSTRGTPPTSSARSATSTAPARPPTTPSAAHRLGYRWETEPPLRNVVAGAAARGGVPAASTGASSGTGCPSALGLLNLEAFRHVLRQRQPHRHRAARGAADAPGRCRRRRRTRTARLRGRYDGTSNDLSAPDDGRGRRDLRPQPPARLPAGPVRRAEPGRGQPAAARPRAVPAGAVAEPARRRVDPVPGARLGQPRPPPARRGRRRGAAARRHDAGRTRRAASPSSADADRRERPVLRRPADGDGAGLRQHGLALVGRLGGLRRRREQGRACCGRARSCG